MGIPAIVSSTPSTTTSSETKLDPKPDHSSGNSSGKLGSLEVQANYTQATPISTNPYPNTVAEFVNNPIALKYLKIDIEEDKAALNGHELTDWQRLPNVLDYTRPLIDLENQTHPDTPIVYVENYEQLAKLVKTYRKDGITNARFVVHHDLVRHESFVDYRLVDGKVSVLNFEPIHFFNVAIASSHDHLVKAVLDDNPEIQYAAMALEVQKDSSNCSIFAINLAKQAARHPEILDNLHTLNIEGRISVPDCKVHAPLSPRLACCPDLLLPKEFMKHSQSQNRTAEYVSANYVDRSASVNAKHQSLQAYQRSHLIDHDGTLKPASIVQKRVKYLEQLYEAATRL